MDTECIRHEAHPVHVAHGLPGGVLYRPLDVEGDNTHALRIRLGHENKSVPQGAASARSSIHWASPFTSGT